ncbi:MAG: site-2 protease family protein [Bacteroidota bacterium]
MFGIPVLLHWSFLILLIVGYHFHQSLDLSKAEAWWWVNFSLAVFSCILLHEFGHALMARRFGVETKDIILLPLGGMARLNKLPEKPWQEFIVALAGPLVNILIALVLFPFFWFITKPDLVAHALPGPEQLDDDYFLFLPLLLFLNLLLAAFNMIPAFPMDGGRMLRALLSIKMGRLKATKMAVGLGAVIAIGLGIYGVFAERLSYPILGLFIIYTALREYRWVKTESLLSACLVSDVFLKDHHRLSLNDDLAEVKKIHGATGQKGFIVFDEMDLPVGVLDVDVIKDQAGSVQDFYQKVLQEIELNASLKKANEVIHQNEVEVLAVTSGNQLVGVLQSDMIWDNLKQKKK